jgi:hypothetical protein
MTVFVVTAFLSPMIVGLGVPYLLAIEGRRWIRAGIFLGAIGGLLALGALVSGRSLLHAGALSIYLGSVAILMAGLFESLRSFKLPNPAGQLLCALALVGLVAGLFCSDPFLQAADRPQDLVAPFVRLSPLAAVASAIDAGDVLRFNVLYGLSRLADYGRNDAHWAGASLRLALIGVALLALSGWRRLIGAKHGTGAKPIQPPDPVQTDRGEGTAAAR